MSIFKFEFAHTIKQIWVIGEVMPEETSALGQLYDTLGVFGVVQGANEVMLRTLEREMGDIAFFLPADCVLDENEQKKKTKSLYVILTWEKLPNIVTGYIK